MEPAGRSHRGLAHQPARPAENLTFNREDCRCQLFGAGRNARLTWRDVPSADNQRRTGVTPGSVRLPVGIGHPDDILADLAQALERG